MKRVLIFSGGRGAGTLINALRPQTDVGLTVLVNAYDDGKSTGEVRKHFEMLGPSDLRKTQQAMMRRESAADRALDRLFSYRFPETMPRDNAISLLRSVGAPRNGNAVAELLAKVDPERRGAIRHYLELFLEHVIRSEVVLGEQFRYADCSLANCVYAGAYEACNRDFERTVDTIGRLLHTYGDVIVNSKEMRYLVGLRSDGQLLPSEAEIVETRTSERLVGIYILNRRLSDIERTNLEHLPLKDKTIYLDHLQSLPQVTARCLTAIQEADIVVYAPGTQHSSLYPTYLTEPVGESIRKNERATKIMITNIGEDCETPAYSASDLVLGAIRHLQASDSRPCQAASYIGFALVNSEFCSASPLRRYVRADEAAIEALGVQPILGWFEDPSNLGKHDGMTLVNAILRLDDARVKVGGRSHESQTNGDRVRSGWRALAIA